VYMINMTSSHLNNLACDDMCRPCCMASTSSNTRTEALKQQVPHLFSKTRRKHQAFRQFANHRSPLALLLTNMDTPISAAMQRRIDANHCVDFTEPNNTRTSNGTASSDGCEPGSPGLFSMLSTTLHPRHADQILKGGRDITLGSLFLYCFFAFISVQTACPQTGASVVEVGSR
jgi:hypothetical protein